MEHIYHPYHLWEEFHAGMWRKRTNEELMLPLAIQFTGDALLYGFYMRLVSRMWRYSCEENLTNLSINRKAWIGHAACCLAIDCPEHVTRSAWWRLTEQQRTDANLQAEQSIQEWEVRHAATIT